MPENPRPITGLRLDPDLRDRLLKFASDTNRTILGAATQLLNEALATRGRDTGDAAQSSRKVR